MSVSRTGDGGELVRPVEDGGVRLVHAQDRSEIPGRAGQPVGELLLAVRPLMADRDREGAVVVEDDTGGAVADRVAVGRVLDQVEVGDRVHGEGPERLHRWGR